MKLRITKEDVLNLTENQKRKLSDMWKPALYDLAMAKICKDADNMEFDEFEFVVGHIEIDDYANIFLFDLSKMNELNNENTKASEEAEDVESSDEIEEFFSVEDFDCSYFRPSYFKKDECIPILNIGQMIDILEKNNFGYNELYINVISDSISCEIGKNSINFDNYGRDFENAELCDVLWQAVKSLL